MYFERGLRFGDYLPDGLLLSIPNERSVLFFDAIQNVRCVWAPAGVWENCVCKCKLGQSDLAAAQKCGRINTRRHRSSGGAAGLQRTVVLVVLEIASAYQHENVPTRVVEANDGALQIFGRRLIRHFTVCLRLAKGSRVSGVSLVIIFRTLLNRFEMSTDRILRCFLEIDIDGRANAKAFIHRAVQSYGRDYLLPDVIDRVRLSLRVLPAGDGDLFCSCSCALFAADRADDAD